MSPHKTLSIEWTESSWEDLNSITDYLFIKDVTFESVEEYIKKIFNAPKQLATLPGAGKPGRMPNTREWIVKDTPYALVYTVHEGKVCILRVIHSSRQFPEQ